MRRSSFALGTVFQQSGIPLAAVLGLAFGDKLHAGQWLGLVLAAVAIGVLGWPRGRVADWNAGLFGLLAGLGFALAANAYRQAALGLDAHHPFVSAQVTLVCVQALQSAVLAAWLAAADRKALAAVLRSWRTSLGAGFFGAAASGLWFTAFALSPAGPSGRLGWSRFPLPPWLGDALVRRKADNRTAVGGRGGGRGRGAGRARLTSSGPRTQDA